MDNPNPDKDTPQPSHKRNGQQFNDLATGTVIALLVIGIGIGWLAGLSVSPVVSVVLTSVTGVAAAIVTILSGLDDNTSEASAKERKRLAKVSGWSLMFLVAGIVAGSALGIYARNNHLLGSDVTSEIEKWRQVGIPKEVVIDRMFGKTEMYSPYTQTYTITLQSEIERWASLGIPREQVVLRLFEQHFSASPSSPSNIESSSQLDNRLGTFLFSANSDECKRLLAAAVMADATSDADRLKNALRNSTMSQLQTLPDLVSDLATLKSLLERVLCADGS